MPSATGLRMLMAVVMAGSALACGGDDGVAPLADGQFNGEVTGHLDGSLSGETFFQVTEASAVGRFDLYMMNGVVNDATHVINLWRYGGRPAVGTYAIDDDEGFGMMMFRGDPEDPGDDADFWAVSGTLTVTQSDPTMFAGSFTMVAGDEPEQVTVTGHFRAGCTPSAGDDISC